jgi:hypothetical protein
MLRSVIAFDRRFAIALALGASALLLACNQEERPRVPLSGAESAANLPEGHPPVGGGGAPLPGLTAAARAALDSGNTAYRAKDFALALRHYREAARAAPAHASPWFGIFMVAQATQNTALADSARREVEKRTVDAPGVADSTLRSTHPKPAASKTATS